MPHRKKPKVITELKADEEEGIDWEGPDSETVTEKIEKIAPQFEPRIKKPGELILATDWNNIQTELKDDIDVLSKTLNLLASHSSILMASGIASHGIYVELNWNSKPIILLSLSGTVTEFENGEISKFRCFPYDIVPKGFKIHALTDDGLHKAIVNWIAFGKKIRG